MSVEDVVAVTDSHQFALWQAFQMVEPSGEWMQDARAALIAMNVRNSACIKESDCKPMSYFLKQLEPVEPQETPKLDPKILEARWAAWAERHNAARARRGGAS